MKFLARNIESKGRIVRGVWAILLLIGSAFGFAANFWIGAVLAVSGGFVAFEALRGWCVLRACGIRTKL